MQLRIKQIFLPTPNINNEYVYYENQLQPRITFGNDKMKLLYNLHEKEIMAVVEQEIREYVNCDDLCNDDEDMFPRRCELTGEWYISEIDFKETDFFSIRTAFLSISDGQKEDYLGLEVCFYYDEQSDKFKFDGINSECI